MESIHGLTSTKVQRGAERYASKKENKKDDYEDLDSHCPTCKCMSGKKDRVKGYDPDDKKFDFMHCATCTCEPLPSNVRKNEDENIEGHGKIQRDDRAFQNVSPYDCPFCGKEFDSRFDLDRHKCKSPDNPFTKKKENEDEASAEEHEIQEDELLKKQEGQIRGSKKNAEMVVGTMGKGIWGDVYSHYSKYGFNITDDSKQLFQSEAKYKTPEDAMSDLKQEIKKYKSKSNTVTVRVVKNKKAKEIKVGDSITTEGRTKAEKVLEVIKERTGEIKIVTKDYTYTYDSGDDITVK